MTPLCQMLTEHNFLKTRKQQIIFLKQVKDTFPDFSGDRQSIFIGDVNKAHIILSVRYDRSIAGVHILCTLLQTLNSITRDKVLFVFTNKNRMRHLPAGIFHIRLDGIAGGDRILVTATEAAQQQYGTALKEAFRPTKTKSVSFIIAKKNPYASAPIVTLSTKKAKQLFVFRKSKPNVPDFSNIKPICDSILHFLRYYK